MNTPGHQPVAARQPAAGGRRREAGRILMWCGVTNLALVFLFAWNMEYRIFAPNGPAKQASANVDSQDPLELSRGLRTDREAPMRVHGDAMPGKRSLSLTVVFAQTSPRSLSWLGQGAQPESGAANAEAAGFEEVLLASSADGENVQGTPVAPLLRRNPKSGRLEIGNFKSMTLDGGSRDCLGTGESLLSELGASAQPIETLTESDQITIARICADNGSVILSCRNDQMTISPRRSRPDDNCKRIS